MPVWWLYIQLFFLLQPIHGSLTPPPELNEDLFDFGDIDEEVFVVKSRFEMVSAFVNVSQIEDFDPDFLGLTPTPKPPVTPLPPFNKEARTVYFAGERCYRAVKQTGTPERCDNTFFCNYPSCTCGFLVNVSGVGSISAIGPMSCSCPCTLSFLFIATCMVLPAGISIVVSTYLCCTQRRCLFYEECLAIRPIFCPWWKIPVREVKVNNFFGGEDDYYDDEEPEEKLQATQPPAFRKPPMAKKPKPKPKTVIVYEVEDPAVQEAYEKYADGDPSMMTTEMASLHLNRKVDDELSHTQRVRAHDVEARPLTTTLGGQRAQELIDDFATRTKIIKAPPPKELMPGSTVLGAGTRVEAPLKKIIQPDYSASERAFLGGVDHPSGGRFARLMQTTDPLIADELLEEGRNKAGGSKTAGRHQPSHNHHNSSSSRSTSSGGDGGVKVSIELPPMGVSVPPIDAEAYLSVGYLASAGSMRGGLGRLRSGSRDQLLTVYHEQDDDDDGEFDEEQHDNDNLSQASRHMRRASSLRTGSVDSNSSHSSHSSHSSNSSDEFTNLRHSHTPMQAPRQAKAPENLDALHTDLFEPSGVDLESDNWLEAVDTFAVDAYVREMRVAEERRQAAVLEAIRAQEEALAQDKWAEEEQARLEALREIERKKFEEAMMATLRPGSTGKPK